VTAPYLAPAPARLGRQTAALHAAATLLEWLGHLGVLNIAVHADYAPGLPVEIDAQIGMVTEDDDEQGDQVRLDRLNAISVLLGLPIRRTWTSGSMHAFALPRFDVDTVPVHLWTAFTTPDVITRADALTTEDRR
jgi:hypothetical protein